MGKRRGGVFLKTGIVAKKQKQDTEVSGMEGGNIDCVVPTGDNLCLLPCRLSQARAMLGLSTWLRWKSTKPTSVATTTKPGLWSSRLQEVEMKCFAGGGQLPGTTSTRACQSSPPVLSVRVALHFYIIHKLLRFTHPLFLFFFLNCFCLACYLLDSVHLSWCQKIFQTLEHLLLRTFYIFHVWFIWGFIKD